MEIQARRVPQRLSHRALFRFVQPRAAKRLAGEPLRGQQFQSAEQWTKAEQAYRSALREDPTLTVAYKALGTTYYLSGDRKDALAAYDSYLESHPQDAATRKFADRLRASLSKGAPGAATATAETASEDQGGMEQPGAQIVKSDGEILNGTIEDMQPNEYVRIRTADNRLYRVAWQDISEFNGRAVRHERRFWQKGWYLDLLELGASQLSYPPATLNTLQALQKINNAPNGDQLEITFLGIYWPVGSARNLLLGFTVDGNGDNRAGTQYQLNQYIDSFSVRYYPFSRIGDGLFLMGDLGPAEVELDGYVERGWGFLGGVGYAFHTGELVSPLLSVFGSSESISGNDPYLAQGTYSAWGVKVGLLW